MIILRGEKRGIKSMSVPARLVLKSNIQETERQSSWRAGKVAGTHLSQLPLQEKMKFERVKAQSTEADSWKCKSIQKWRRIDGSKTNTWMLIKGNTWKCGMEWFVSETQLGHGPRRACKCGRIYFLSRCRVQTFDSGVSLSLRKGLKKNLLDSMAVWSERGF